MYHDEALDQAFIFKRALVGSQIIMQDSITAWPERISLTLALYH
jgi:hypothetical protein